MTTLKIKELEKKAEKIQEDLRKAKAKEKEKIKTLSKAQLFAEELHEECCTSNHVDHCGFQYETWDNPQWSKKSWLKKAEKLIEKKYKIEDVLEIQKIIN